MGFTFKRFHIDDSRSAMKVTTDSALLGAWVDVTGVRRVLDVGAGCGILSLMVAQRAPESVIDAVEIDTASAKDAQSNFERSEQHENLRVLTGDIFEMRELGEYDLIISNPPFFNETLQSPDTHRAKARHEQALSVESLIRFSKEKLKEGGRLAFIAPTARDEEIKSMLVISGFEVVREMRYRQRTGRPLVRTLWEVAQGYGKPPTTEEIDIVDERGEYSEGYKKLLKEFMLKF